MKNVSKKDNKKSIIPNFIKKIFARKWVRVLIIVILMIYIIGKILTTVVENQLKQIQKDAIQTEVIEKRDIERILSSSGSIQPLNTYEVTTLVDGEVIAANFEEGDQVKEGDVLYQITTDSLDTRIESAKDSVEKAKRNYERAIKGSKDATKDYNKATEELGNKNIEADVSGVITELNVKVGDVLQKGSQIGKIYDNSSMLLEIPFSSSDVDQRLVGQEAIVEIDESGESLVGVVTRVSSLEVALSGNRVTKAVTIQVNNPGGLTTTTSATATIGNSSSSEEGTFTVIEDTVLTASNSGKVSKIMVSEGARVNPGDTIIILDSESVMEQLDSYENALDNANNTVEDSRDSIKDAENALQEQIDALTDYSIKAPISGQVISKNTLVGDNIRATSMNSSLCTIYDLSAVTFEMNIDELDIMSVEVGQEVKVVADALEGVEITGSVTNISLKSTTIGGVTQYPVTVRIDEVGNLLPGMNVTGEIVVERAEDVVALPVDALMRGDVVYVKDESVTEAVGDVPVGFREVDVTTGISDGDYIEILEGVTVDQEVYVVREGSGIQSIFSVMDEGPTDDQGPNGEPQDKDRGGDQSEPN